MPQLMIQAEERAGAYILRLSGRLTHEEVEPVHRSLGRAWASNATRVILDFSDCPYVDSSGLAALVAGLSRAQESKKVFALTGLRPQLFSLLQLTRLDKVFAIFPSVERALAG